MKLRIGIALFILLVAIYPARTHAASTACRLTVPVNTTVDFTGNIKPFGQPWSNFTWQFGINGPPWQYSGMNFAPNESIPSKSFTFNTPGTFVVQLFAQGIAWGGFCGGQSCSNQVIDIWPVAYGKVAPYWGHSDNVSTDGSANCLVTVVAPTYPDLTSTIGSSVTTVAGQSTSFSGTTYNNGNATANAGFQDLFVFYKSDQSTWDGSQYAAASGSLGSGGASAARSVNYTFATPGTYYYRLCSDWPNSVSESDEGNNCSAMQVVNVRPAMPTSLSASCQANGTSGRLTWSPPSSGASSYYVRVHDITTNTDLGWASNYPATSYNVSITPGHTYSWWIHSDIGGGDGQWIHYSDQADGNNFSCSGSPDLTAGIGPSVTTVAGQSTTYTGTTYNNGNATANAGFNDLFLYWNAAQNAWVTWDYVYSNPAMGAGGNAARSVSRALGSPGTYYYQLCADWNGGIAESNESNNCSALQSIYVRPAPPTISAAPTCNSNGTLATLAWSAPAGGADNYYARVRPQSDVGCPVNWTKAVDGIGVGYYCIPTSGTPPYTDSVVGTSVLYGMVPGVTYDWWVHSNMGANDYTYTRYSDPAGGPSFTCSGTADLTPLSLTPSTVVAGQSSTFTATLQNGGNATTPSFSSTIYVCAQGDTSCINNPMARAKNTIWRKILAFFRPVAEAATSIKITLTGSPIAAGTNGTQSGSQTFASAGTYQARLCADLPLNEVDEGAAGENNNCANWQILTVCPSGNTIDSSGNCVPPATPAPTCNLSASPANAPSSLTWSSSNATSCTGGGGSFTTGNATSGTFPGATAGTYTLSCTGAGGSCAANTTVNGAICAGPAAVDIKANGLDGPVRIQTGSSPNLTWTATDVPASVTSCSITGPGVNQIATPSAAPTCAIPAGSASPTVTTQSTYTINCGGVTDSVIVNVTPQFQNF